MFEESMSIPGIWASMNRWFTPTVLFVLLNVMIGTIAVTSGLGGGTSHKQQQEEEDHQEHDQNTEDSNSNTNQHQNQEQNYLARSPSVLQRLKSINFYSYTYRSQEPISMPTPETHTHQQEHHHHIHEPEQQPHRTHEEEEEEEVEGEKLTMDEVYGKLHGSHNRTHSDLKPSSGEVLTKLPKKMKKSASAKSAFAHFKEHDIVESRRPATVRELQAPKVIEEAVDEDGDDEEVDAKADDFINRFKKQLKLQRLDSITRYKDMLKRGSAKQ